MTASDGGTFDVIDVEDSLRALVAEEPPRKLQRMTTEPDLPANLLRSGASASGVLQPPHKSDEELLAEADDDAWSTRVEPIGFGSQDTITSFPTPLPPGPELRHSGSGTLFMYDPTQDEDDLILSQPVSIHDDGDVLPLWESQPSIPGHDSLVRKVGTTGCILGPEKRGIDGAVVEMGFEFLVRIALRNILLCPPQVQQRLLTKFGKHTPVSQNISTTYSGTDCIIHHKMAVIIACRLITGLQQKYDDHCSFTIIQTLAAERDEWKRNRAIQGRPKHPSVTLRVLAKVLLCYVFAL